LPELEHQTVAGHVFLLWSTPAAGASSRPGPGGGRTGRPFRGGAPHFVLRQAARTRTGPMTYFQMKYSKLGVVRLDGVRPPLSIPAGVRPDRPQNTGVQRPKLGGEPDVGGGGSRGSRTARQMTFGAGVLGVGRRPAGPEVRLRPCFKIYNQIHVRLQRGRRGRPLVPPRGPRGFQFFAEGVVEGVVERRGVVGHSSNSFTAAIPDSSHPVRPRGGFAPRSRPNATPLLAHLVVAVGGRRPPGHSTRTRLAFIQDFPLPAVDHLRLELAGAPDVTSSPAMNSAPVLDLLVPVAQGGCGRRTHPSGTSPWKAALTGPRSGAVRSVSLENTRTQL